MTGEKTDKYTIRWSIKWKMMILLSVLLVSLVTILTYLQASSQTKMMEDELTKRISLIKENLIERGRSFIVNLAQYVESDIASFNFSGALEKIEDIVRTNKEIKYAIVLDTNGMVLIHTRDSEMINTIFPVEKLLYSSVNSSIRVKEFMEDGESVLEIKSPLQTSTMPWGEIRLICTLKYIEREIATACRQINEETQKIICRSVITSAGFLFISFIIVYIASLQISTPIIQLTRMTRRMSTGDFPDPFDIHIDSRDEVGILAKAFVQMSRDLKSSYERLVREIEERKRVENALRASEEMTNVLLNAPADMAALISTDGTVLALNNKAAERIGKSPQEIVGKAVDDYCLTDIAEKRIKLVERAVLFKKTVPFEDHLNGNYFEGDVIPIIDINGYATSVAIFERDITEKKLMQGRIIRTERLAATGQLAASLAHEINSPLQGILSLLAEISDNGKDDQEYQENVNLIRNAIENIRNIIKNLLDLNRPGKEIKQDVNINDIIESTTALVRNHMKKNRIRVNMELCSHMPAITASPQQIGQVLMNLINNAVEVITSDYKAGNGKKSKSGSIGEISIKTLSVGDNVVLTVADTGSGIPEEVRDRIFDPFFTRKKKMGMGIGLSICHGIIENHKGIISVGNTSDGGAVFTISLPVDKS